MNQEWVIHTIKELAQFNDGQRGITRISYSETEKRAREYVMNIMKEIGLETRVDEAGNIIGRLAGADPHAAAVLTGSHIDTIPESGMFDGVVGVVGALQAIKVLKDKKMNHSIEVVVFSGKQSNQFGYINIGSKALAGLVPHKAARDRADIKAYLELHIEQGPLLDREKKAIGIVETISGTTRLKITVQGVANHSGSTPMECRNDALISAAMVVLAVQEIAMEQSYQGTVATVGKLMAYPGEVNVIPGLVEMSVDIVGINQENVIETLQEIMDEVTNIAKEQETPVEMKVMTSEKPIQMDAGIRALIEEICQDKKTSYLQLNSGESHDAMSMARITPTGMIFIPSKDGISNNPAEYTEIKDIMKGIEILTEVIYHLGK